MLGSHSSVGGRRGRAAPSRAANEQSKEALMLAITLKTLRYEIVVMHEKMELEESVFGFVNYARMNLPLVYEHQIGLLSCVS